jgi:GxxExxY protein
MADLLYKSEVFDIQGAVFEVYRNLGAGFLENVYQEALEIELESRNIPFVSQSELKIRYKDEILKQSYRADIVCFDKIILELKAVKALLPEHEAQLQNYLRATGMHLGLLINFCHVQKVEIKRIAL